SLVNGAAWLIAVAAATITTNKERLNIVFSLKIKYLSCLKHSTESVIIEQTDNSYNIDRFIR
ncbi:MAG: hypothetical protein H9855_05570, partial [Candidatus Acinetobacter avistercoris]|nr:hypothetical protein [Candidatus Acinetobacter avistercoris]